jgi:uncharacterized protein (TIGR03437 family)
MRHQAFLQSGFPSRSTRRLLTIRFALRTALVCSFVTGAFAQLPLIYNRSTYNAASYLPAGIPAGGIAQGSIFTVFGTNLGPLTAAGPHGFPLGTTLAGVSLNVIQGTTTVSAIPLYVSATQINAIMPSNAPLGMASLQVIFNNGHSNMSPVQITNTALGIFTALGTGLGPGAIQNLVSASSQPSNTPYVSAKPGQAVTLYGTGLGPITEPDNGPPPVGNLPTQVQVFVGGVAAQVLYSGRSPCCAGQDQIVFNVPANAPQGCWVPVYVKTAGSVVSNFVSMAISTKGGACTNPTLPIVSSAFLNGGQLGAAIVARANTYEDSGVYTPVNVIADYHLSFGFALSPVTFPFNPAVTLPPPGTCTSYAEEGDLVNGDSLPGSLPPATSLDLGPPFLLTGPNGSRMLTSTFVGPVRAGYLGGQITNNILSDTLYLNPGSYSVTGFGGANVGAFMASFAIPEPLTWTNQTQLVIVNRAQPLPLAWSGGSSGDMNFIVGVGEDLPTNSSAVFVCVVPPGATSFTVPADMLSNLPATRPNPLQSKDVIYIITAQGPSIKNVKATGLNYGATASYSIDGKTVVLQ